MISTENTSQIAFDNEFSPNDVCVALIKLIDKKINNCKLEHLSAWEKNHNIDKSETDNKISALISQKEELLNVIDTEDFQNVKLLLKK